MSQFLENEVLDLYNNLTFKEYDDIGVPPSISVDEAKDYCSMVLKELSRSKKIVGIMMCNLDLFLFNSVLLI